MLDTELLKQAGLSQEKIDRLLQDEKKEIQDKVKSTFLNRKSVQTLIAEMKSLEVPLEIVLSLPTVGTDPTVIVRSPRGSSTTSTSTSSGGRNGKVVEVKIGEEVTKYQSMMEACQALNLGNPTDLRVSGRILLDRWAKETEGASWSLAEAA